jgi:hypothetical protein
VVVVMVMVVMLIAAVAVAVVRHFDGERQYVGACGRTCMSAPQFAMSSQAEQPQQSNEAPLTPEITESKGKDPEGPAAVAEPPTDFKVWNPPAGEASVSSRGVQPRSAEVAYIWATC